MSKDKITNNKKTEINEKTQFYTKFWNLVKFKKENEGIFCFEYFCHDNINYRCTFNSALFADVKMSNLVPLTNVK